MDFILPLAHSHISTLLLSEYVAYTDSERHVLPDFDNASPYLIFVLV